MSIEKLKKIASHLMTNSRPKLHMEIDGKQLRMDGAQARAFGCGVDVALKTLADEIDNNEHHIAELEQRLAAAESKIAETEALPDWAKVGDGTLHSAIDYWYERATVAEYRLAAAESRNAELELGLRWACDVFMVPDDFDNGERDACLHRSMAYAINHGEKYWNAKVPGVTNDQV